MSAAGAGGLAGISRDQGLPGTGPGGPTSLPHPIPVPINGRTGQGGQPYKNVEDEAMILLKKQDLEAMLSTRQVAANAVMDKQYVAAAGSAPLGASPIVPYEPKYESKYESKTKAKLATLNGDVDYKKLAMVNDDLLKMWEESQAENTRLRMEMSQVKSDLESTKYQLQQTSKAVSTRSALSDTEKREKKIVEKKLMEMEEELKLLALSENLTDQTLSQLKSDNQRLRDENQALVAVISGQGPATRPGSVASGHHSSLGSHHGGRGQQQMQQGMMGQAGMNNGMNQMGQMNQQQRGMNQQQNMQQGQQMNRGGNMGNNMQGNNMGNMQGMQQQQQGNQQQQRGGGMMGNMMGNMMGRNQQQQNQNMNQNQGGGGYQNGGFF